MQNPHFGSKIKIPKNMSKFILQIIYSCCVQKTAPKNTKYSRNETILKIGKIVALVLKFKLRKTCEKRGWNHSTVGLCRKRPQKQANIRKIFLTWQI